MQQNMSSGMTKWRESHGARERAQGRRGREERSIIAYDLGGDGSVKAVTGGTASGDELHPEHLAV